MRRISLENGTVAHPISPIEVAEKCRMVLIKINVCLEGDAL